VLMRGRVATRDRLLSHEFNGHWKDVVSGVGS